jgi:hypothetical protein
MHCAVPITCCHTKKLRRFVGKSISEVCRLGRWKSKAKVSAPENKRRPDEPNIDNNGSPYGQPRQPATSHALLGPGDDSILLHIQKKFGTRLFSSFVSGSRVAFCRRSASPSLTNLMSGVNMFAMALVMRVILGWTSLSAYYVLLGDSSSPSISPGPPGSGSLPLN